MSAGADFQNRHFCNIIVYSSVLTQNDASKKIKKNLIWKNLQQTSNANATLSATNQSHKNDQSSKASRWYELINF
jgi:hypothetical protein